MSKIFTVPELARRHSLSEERVRQLIREGRLPATKYGPVYLVLETDADFYFRYQGKRDVAQEP